MDPIFFAEVILILHFIFVGFVISLFFFIPLGYKLNWVWQKNKKIRFFHLGLIVLITTETILGFTCPLTMIENKLRGIITSNTFISIWMTNLLYWDLPTQFFLIIYSLCLVLVILMWIKFPPIQSK